MAGIVIRRAGGVQAAGEPRPPGLYAILAEHELAITRASETISATTLGPRDARDLARPEAADRVVITANRSAERLEVNYTLAG